MGVRIQGGIPIPTDLDVTVSNQPQPQPPPPASEPGTEAPSSPAAGSVEGMDKAAAQSRMNQASIDELVRKAGLAGLSDADTAKLRTVLTDLSKSLPQSEFLGQTRLFEDALHSGDRFNAMRTFIDIAPLRTAHPDRITNDIERCLVMGAGLSRSENYKGELTRMSGILGEDAARHAAATLINMPQSEFKQISDQLELAGLSPSDSKAPNLDASAETERALILKAVAAREKHLGNPDALDQAKMAAGLPMNATAQIIAFAQQIRGQHRSDVLEKSTVQDLDRGEHDHALQQRYTTSCGPTSAQITEAEADPITALRMHQEAIHSTTAAGNIATEQKVVLTAAGGTAVPRGHSGGQGIQLPPALNQIASDVTHRRYSAVGVGDSKQGRTDAMDQMQNLLEQRISVPIRVAWKDGGGHFEVATQVQGEKPNRMFFITDPWNGKGNWVEESKIASGDTDFSAGKGRLTHIYPGVPD